MLKGRSSGANRDIVSRVLVTYIARAQVYSIARPARLSAVVLDSCLNQYDQDLAVQLLTATAAADAGAWAVGSMLC